ncbi:MAG: hypothetical protein IJS53_01135, partial [Clostridia bacterium]|nr:hypothetical protein [Clostridia bacterium]
HAACYAVVAVQTAWLKYYYPTEFMAAMMNSVVGNAPKVAGYIQYCRGKGIPVLPPHVNRSDRQFTVETDEQGVKCVRMGMSGVKNVGNSAVDAIVRQRAAGGPFRDIYDFCRRIDSEIVNKRCVESLVMAGCFDGMGATRLQCAQVFQQAMEANANKRKQNVAGQISLFDLGQPTAELMQQDVYPDVGEYPYRQLLEMEKEMTGIYLSGHPLDEYRRELEGLSVNTSWVLDLKDRPDGGAPEDGRRVTMGGMLAEFHSKVTRKGSLMGFGVLEDLTGQIECLFFPKVFERQHALLQQDAAVLLTGRLSVREEEDTKLLVDTVEPLTPVAARKAPPQPEPEAAPLPDPERAKRSPVKLYVRMTRGQMEKVRALLLTHPGDVPVYINLPEEGVTLLTPAEWWCDDAAATRDTLLCLLRPDDVRVVDKRPGGRP